MDNIPRTHKDIETLIHEIQAKKKEILVENNDRGIGLSQSGLFDSDIYDGGGGKGKYEGYVTSIAANDEDDDEDEDATYSQKKTGWGAPVIFFNDLAKSSKDYDPFADKRRPTIADREDEYHQRRRRVIISPERVDPFADSGKTPDLNARGYSQIMKEQMLKRDEHELRRKILEKSKDGSLKSTKSEVKSAPKKRGRWDQTADDVGPSKRKTLSVSTVWDADKTGDSRKRNKEEDRRHESKNHFHHDDRRSRKHKSYSSDHESRKKRRS